MKNSYVLNSFVFHFHSYLIPMFLLFMWFIFLQSKGVLILTDILPPDGAAVSLLLGVNTRLSLWNQLAHTATPDIEDRMEYLFPQKDVIIGCVLIKVLYV
jgi:uncharacterized membrane protein